MKKILVCGAGGFIGGHLVAELRRQGGSDAPRAVDRKPLDEWYQRFDDVENLQLNLERLEDCRIAVQGCDVVYNLAADMGGMGFIELNKALCMLSVLINTHLLMAAREVRRAALLLLVERLRLQRRQAARPERHRAEGRGRLSRACRRTATAGRSFSASACAGISARTSASQTRVARYHNVYGPHGTYDGGREKAPAAICRKVIEAKLTGQARDRDLGRRPADAQLHVHRRLPARHADAHRAATSSSRSTSAATSSSPSTSSSTSWKRSPGIKLERSYNLDAPKGVNGRNSRQHADQTSLRLGTLHAAARRAGDHLPLDLRRDDESAHRRRRVGGQPRLTFPKQSREGA